MARKAKLDAKLDASSFVLFMTSLVVMKDTI